MKWIPNISGLENGEYFRENTIIYDKDGNEIYSVFKNGKRTYIEYDGISRSITDAVVSIEDKSFFENPGIDIFWLLRVGVSYVTNGKIGGRIWGASTISQQLIKNTLLTNEKSIKRKVQEAVLSYQMNKDYSKEKILEMYLNTISFWNNSNGVEQASRTFFWKSAKDVGPLWGTILASIINAPTRYSPYLHRDKLMGKIEVYTATDPENRIILQSTDDKKLYAPLYNEFKSYLSGITIERQDSWAKICWIKEDFVSKDSPERDSFLPDDGCADIPFDSLGNFFGSIKFDKEVTVKDVKEKYTIEYTIWRKDIVAIRMLEDNKIDGSTFKKIIYDGIDFEFKKYTENIKYPHFVMYVNEYLEKKYGKDMDITSGLRIYTTIDPKLQEKAEEVIKKQVESNKKIYGASNAALVSMDNFDGKLLAMVGGANYFDTENGGNNNMATSDSIRPWSSFKPFVYAMAIAKNPIGPESPVADVDTKFGSWNPDNYDGSFLGVMMVKNALDYSRNIPAIKMYFLAGQQDEIVKNMRKMWVTTLQEEKEHAYGGSIALGAWEVKPIELMQAYSVLANMWTKKDLYFIEKIETTDGTIIEEHKKTEWEIAFSPAASYIISKILSDNSARPESSYWRNALTINGKNVAAKTGTADGKTKTGKKYPRDLWTAWYSPQITTIVWAGNTDGSLLSPKAESLNSAAPIWKQYMEFALKDLPKVEWKKPEWIYTYNIAKTSGKLATKNTPEDQVVSTIMAVKLNEYDEWSKEIKIDTLCNGAVTDATPPDAIKTIYIPSGKPVIDGYDPAWTSSFFESLKKWGTGTWSTTDIGNTGYSETPCNTRPQSTGNVTINIDRTDKKIATVGFIGDRMIQKIIIDNNGNEQVFDYWSGAKKTSTENIQLNTDKSIDISVNAIDIYWYRYTESRTLETYNNESNINSGSTVVSKNPEITMINPKGKSISLYVWDIFNLRFRVEVGTTTREIQIFIDNTLYQTATSGEIFVIPMSSVWLIEWNHIVRIKAIDGNFKTTETSFSLNVLPR